MVVLLCTERVDRNVANQCRICLTRRVEAERNRDVRRALEIAIDGLRNSDDLRLALVGLEVLREQGGIRVGVVAADDNQSMQVDALADGHGVRELLGGLDLVPATAKHVEAASVAEAVDDVLAELDKVAPVDATRSVEEPHEGGVGMPLLDPVEHSCDDVMSSRGLAAREYHAKPDLAAARHRFAVADRLLELHRRHAIGQWEQLPDRRVVL
mmetsp:Transcript_47575/g.151861  ORF Transcript_47575/g.151861 Transcript_47575/m.151861 type:complete len:212 (-) Transcript_47575:218-853(-)